MRQFPLAGSDHDERVGLPAVVEQLLVAVVTDGFTLHCCGPKTAPHALVASYEWDHYIDLLTIQDFAQITTARVPTRDTVDIFAPQVVVWAYEGPPHQALPALLDLVHPAHPNAPTTSHPAPPSLHIPRAQQRPMTIQPPAPNHAGTRAARLATAMTIPSGDRATLGCLVGRTISGWPLVELGRTGHTTPKPQPTIPATPARRSRWPRP
jgi:hypothetical protein